MSSCTCYVCRVANLQPGMSESYATNIPWPSSRPHPSKARVDALAFALLVKGGA